MSASTRERCSGGVLNRHELIKRLTAVGLNKQQATSITEETLVKLYMPEDGKMLLEEARLQATEMRETVNRLKIEYGDIEEKDRVGIGHNACHIRGAERTRRGDRKKPKT